MIRAGFGIVYAPTDYAQGTVVSDFDSGTPGYGAIIGQLQNGIPSTIKPIWPNFSAAAGAVNDTVGAGPAVLGPGAGRPPRQYQWSVGVQRAVTRNTVLEASYVGNRVIWLNAPGSEHAQRNVAAASESGRFHSRQSCGRDPLTHNLREPHASPKRDVGIPRLGSPVCQVSDQPNGAAGLASVPAVQLSYARGSSAGRQLVQRVAGGCDPAPVPRSELERELRVFQESVPLRVPPIRTTGN